MKYVILNLMVYDNNVSVTAADNKSDERIMCLIKSFVERLSAVLSHYYRNERPSYTSPRNLLAYLHYTN